MPDINRWPFPINRGSLGVHPDEVRDIRRRVEKNPYASPMPALAPTQLLQPTRTSEDVRLGEPKALAEIALALNNVLTFVALRRLLRKARRRGAVLFDDAVEREMDEAEEDLPEGRREKMRQLLERERAMMDVIDHYSRLAEDVHMRLLAGTKG